MTNYPGSLDTIETLFGNLTDVATTTLNNAINTNDLVVTVTDPSKFPLTRQIILIENELIIFTSRTGNVYNAEQRGAYGTTPAAHASGARFRLIYSAAHHNLVVESILDMQSELQYHRSPVESDTITDPATLTPTEGQQWIVPVGAVGAWAGSENSIARWNTVLAAWEFITELDGMSVYIRDRDGVYSWNGTIWKTSQTQEQRDNTIHNMRTGLIGGGILTIGTDPATFDLGAGSAYFVDSYTNPAVPTYKYMEWGTLTAEPVPGLANNNWTFVFMDATGNLVQTNLPPEAESFRDLVFLGVLYHRDRTEISNIVLTPNNGVYAYLEQDYLDIERIFNKSGNVYGPFGGLTLTKSSGQTFGPSINYDNNRKNPNTTDDPQDNLLTLAYRARSGVNDEFTEYTPTTFVDAEQYDLDGVLTPVPTANWTVQRIYWNPVLQKTVITYGQIVYTNVQDALASAANPGILDAELTYDSVFRGILVVQQGATDLTDPNFAQFVDAAFFGTGAAGSGEVNSGQNVGGGVEVYKTKLSVFLVFRTLVSDTAAITITQNTDTINFNFIPGAVDHQTLANVGTNTHAMIDTFIADINTYIDPRVILRETPNVLKVRPNPNPGEFASVAAAVASIITATPDSPWEVTVAPGTYIEPTIVMKPNVIVRGHGADTTIIEAAIPTDDLVTASSSSGLAELTLRGSSGVGAALIRFDSAVSAAGFVVSDVNLLDAETLVSMDIATGSASLSINNVFLGGTYQTGVFTRAALGSIAAVVLNSVTSSSTSAPADLIHVEGLGALLLGTNVLAQAGTATPGSNAVHLANGAFVQMNGLTVNNFARGIWIEDVGLASHIEANSATFLGCTIDLEVSQPSATGYVNRPSNRAKIILDPATAVYIPNVDLQIVTVAKRGGDFTSIAAAVAAITDASVSKPYTVKVGPGVFVEPTIVMKPFISVQGAGADVETIINPAAPNQDIIASVANSAIRDIQLAGVTGTGAAVRHIGTGTLTAFSVFRCRFGVNSQHVIVDATAGAGVVRVDSSRVVGAFVTGFQIIGATTNIGRLLWTNTNFQIVGTSLADVVHLSGSNAQLYLNNIVGTGAGLGNFLRFDDGAKVKLASVTIDLFAKGIWSENVGAGPDIQAIATQVANSTVDVQIDHPATTGAINGALDRTKVLVNPASTVTFAYADSTNNAFVSTGEFFLGPNGAQVVEVSDLFIKAPPMGLLMGGALSDGGGLTVNVAAGVGYTNSGLLQKIEWANTSIVLAANTAQYVYFNSNGILVSGGGFPDTRLNILLGRVVTNATGIEILDITPFVAEHAENRTDVLARIGLGVVYDTGSIVTATPARNLNVSAGSYFLSGNRFLPSGGNAISFRTHFRDGIGGFTLGNATVVNNTSWDNNSGTLVPLTAGWYAKHALYTVGQGVNEKYLFVYAQAQYLDLTVTEQANIPAPPSYFTDGIVLIASVIVQQGVATINQVRDERPVLGFKSAGIAASSDHGNLLGLTDDDHLQYFRTDGARVMAGNIDMGGNSIVNVNLVDGVDVSAHAARHQPNGADPIPTAAGIAVLPNNANGVGTSNSLARADHVHALPTAAAVQQLPDQANAVGTANTAARSDHVHNIPAAAPVTQAPDTGNIKGVAATFALSDHQHDIPAAAPVTPLSATTADAEGAGTSFSRNDHTHSIVTAAPVTQNPDQANALGSASALARADHVHNIPADAPTTTLSPATANAEGTGSAFARNDHTHAIATAVAADISTIVPDAAASAGTAANYARGDHVHAIVADAPVAAINANAANGEGVGTSFSRNDHVHSIATGAASSQAPDQANAAGTSGNLARADHTHNIPTAAPVAALSATTTNAQGTGVSFARNDHGHAILTGAPSTQTPDQTNTTGTSANLARADHVHQIPTAAAVGLDAASANTQGNAATFARSNHTHAIATGTPSTQTPNQANAVGVSASLARADHIHNIPTAAPTANLSATTGNGAGTAGTFAASDHSHAVSTGAASTQVPDQVNATGTSPNLARADHVHTIATAAPSASLSATTANAQGASTSFSRADHGHAILTGAASTQNPDQANTAGTSASLARADHVHNIPTDVAVTLDGTANTQGTSNSFARADHTHIINLPRQQAYATPQTTTTSTSYVALAGMSITPGAGTWMAMFVGVNAQSSGGSDRTFYSFFANGAQVANSEIPIGNTIAGSLGTSGNQQANMFHEGITVAAGQAIEVRWRVAGGTGGTTYRKFVLVRVGP